VTEGSSSAVLLMPSGYASPSRGPPGRHVG
jgi:hypothetical protein